MTTKTKEPKVNGKDEISKDKEIVLPTSIAQKLESAIEAKNQAARDYQIAINWEKEVLGIIYEYENIKAEEVLRAEIEGEILKLNVLV